MYEHPFSLQIIAPDRIVFQGDVTSVSAPGTKGGFQVLFNHAPFLSSLTPGPVIFKKPDGTDTVYATGGGFFEVRDNKAVVLVESAELPVDIDVARAAEAKARAQNRLKSPDPAIDTVRAELALARAIHRLHMAGKK
jgi:F-type H+-transporting ATPase subunit epsilon